MLKQYSRISQSLHETLNNHRADICLNNNTHFQQCPTPVAASLEHYCVIV